MRGLSLPALLLSGCVTTAQLGVDPWDLPVSATFDIPEPEGFIRDSSAGPDGLFWLRVVDDRGFLEHLTPHGSLTTLAALDLGDGYTLGLAATVEWVGVLARLDPTADATLWVVDRGTLELREVILDLADPDIVARGERFAAVNDQFVVAEEGIERSGALHFLSVVDGKEVVVPLPMPTEPLWALPLSIYANGGGLFVQAEDATVEWAASDWVVIEGHGQRFSRLDPKTMVWRSASAPVYRRPPVYSVGVTSDARFVVRVPDDEDGRLGLVDSGTGELRVSSLEARGIVGVVADQVWAVEGSGNGREYTLYDLLEAP